VQETTLAARTPEQAAQLFQLIKDDFLLSQVFFELSREAPRMQAVPPLHAVGIGDLLRHTRLSGAERLSHYFGAINQAFQAIRDDPAATLFGFDQQGHVYVHEATCRSIRQLWEQLFARPPLSSSDGALANGPMAAALAAPQLGPSEAIASHMPAGNHDRA
jgi:hypothetical protein